eukprot:TRINITY_DN7055_c0_g1_i1.p1 TRINITY_DN7055_c0_g1~~TRINITY_DN7055_c0_g1_i1.p1  ORF type:complete len:580 (+),score=130.00 TRINITY_DN7055_c0_g1_i1:238-1977(+)
MLPRSTFSGERGSVIGMTPNRGSIGMNSVSVAVVGSQQSNKALFISKFVGLDKFEQDFAETLSKQIDLEKASYDLKILTTAGLEDYLFLSEEHLVEAQGYVFVYNVYSRESFDYYSAFREALIRLKQTERVPMILVGFSPNLETEGEREVSTDEGKRLAELGGFSFREIFGNDSNKISDVFKDILNEVLTSYVGKSAQPSSWSFDASSGEIIELERVPECSILVVGDCFVGKTTLIGLLKSSTPKKSYVSTGTLEILKQEFTKEKERYSLTIMDTPGLWEDKDFTKDEILFVQGVVIVYSVLSRASFMRIEELYRSILKVVGKEKIPVVLVGNKADQTLEYRNVKYEEGAALAKKLGCPFYEVTIQQPAQAIIPFAAIAKGVASHLKESSDILQLEPEDLQKSGSLHVGDKTGKKWVPQQFEIHDNILMSDGKVVMTITGTLSIEIDDSLNSPGKFAFVITGDKKLYLAASTEEERKGWVNSISVNSAISEIASVLIEEVMHKMLTEHLPKGLKPSVPGSRTEHTRKLTDPEPVEENFSLSSSGGSIRKKGLFNSLRRGSTGQLKPSSPKKEDKKSKKG